MSASILRRRLASLAQTTSLLVHLSLLAGCYSGEEITSHPTIASPGPILDFRDPRSRATVAISVFKPKNMEVTCSGVLVHEKLVLTTAQCLSNATQVRAIYHGWDLYKDAISLRPGEFRMHPAFVPGAGEGSEGHADNIAWIKVDSPLPRLAAPVPLWTEPDATPEPVGKRGTVIGYGAEAPMAVLKRTRQSAEIMFMQLDDHTEGPARPKVWQGSALHGSPCLGDGGAPLFIAVKNGWALAGLYVGSVPRAIEGAATGPQPEESRASSGNPCLNASSLYASLSGHKVWLKESTGLDLIDSDASMGTEKRDDFYCPTGSQFDLESGYCAVGEGDAKAVISPFNEATLKACEDLFPDKQCRKLYPFELENRRIELYKIALKDLKKISKGTSCVLGGKRDPLFGGYCIEEKPGVDSAGVAYGPFRRPLVHACERRALGDFCRKQTWPAEALFSLVAPPEAVFSRKNFGSVLGLLGTTQQSAESVVKGILDDGAKTFSRSLEEKSLLVRAGGKSKVCMKFSSDPGACLVKFYSGDGKNPSTVRGQCAVGHSKRVGQNWLTLHCRTATGFVCDRGLATASDHATGLIYRTQVPQVQDGGADWQLPITSEQGHVLSQVLKCP